MDSDHASVVGGRCVIAPNRRGEAPARRRVDAVGPLRDIVLENAPGGGQWVNRTNDEICALRTLRERLWCKEICLAGADRFGKSAEDLPPDFAERRAACHERRNLLTPAHHSVDRDARHTVHYPRAAGPRFVGSWR